MKKPAGQPVNRKSQFFPEIFGPAYFSLRAASFCKANPLANI